MKIHVLASHSFIIKGRALKFYMHIIIIIIIIIINIIWHCSVALWVHNTERPAIVRRTIVF